MLLMEAYLLPDLLLKGLLTNSSMELAMPGPIPGTFNHSSIGALIKLLTDLKWDRRVLLFVVPRPGIPAIKFASSFCVLECFRN
jgi:hypothetical protein